MPSSQVIELSVGGAVRSFAVAPLTRLLSLLRYHLQLTGTKEGCADLDICFSRIPRLTEELMNAL